MIAEKAHSTARVLFVILDLYELVVCPLPKEDLERRPIGLHTLDIRRSTGTAYEGRLWLPKPQGVKKGWLKCFGAITGNRFFVFIISEDRKAPLINCQAAFSFDLREECFSVETVRPEDAIHANKKEIESIFRLRSTSVHRTTSITQSVLRFSILMKCQNTAEKQKWIDYLSKVNKSLKHSLPPPVFSLIEAYDPSLILIKTMITADIISKDRIILGSEDGLYCMDLKRHVLIKIMEKKVLNVQISKSQNVKIIVVISGTRRAVRVMPLKAATEPQKFAKEIVKLEQIRGASLISISAVSQNSLSLVIAARKTLFCYEVTEDDKEAISVKHKQEISLDYIPQYLFQSMNSPYIVVGSTLGYSNYLAAWNTANYSYDKNGPKHLLSVKQDSAMSTLLENKLLQHPMHALCCFDLGSEQKEYLLCFSKFAIYVNYEGERSRQSEIMWPSEPKYICCHHPPDNKPPVLICFMDNSIELYDVYSGQWIQSIACRRLRPLNTDGSLSCMETDTRRLLLISNPNESVEVNEHWIELPLQFNPALHKRQLVKKSKISFEFKVPDSTQKKLASKLRDPVHRKILISGPVSDTFQHLEHMDRNEHSAEQTCSLTHSTSSLARSASSSDVAMVNIDL